MKKLTTLFLTLALLAGMSAVFGANAADAVKKLPKPDSYEALKLDPKHGIGDNLVDSIQFADLSKPPPAEFRRVGQDNNLLRRIDHRTIYTGFHKIRGSQSIF